MTADWIITSGKNDASGRVRFSFTLPQGWMPGDLVTIELRGMFKLGPNCDLFVQCLGSGKIDGGAQGEKEEG